MCGGGEGGGGAWRACVRMAVVVSRDSRVSHVSFVVSCGPSFFGVQLLSNV